MGAAASFHGKEFNTENTEGVEDTEKKKQRGSEDPPLQKR
jgi:hypothetical protein